MKLIGMPEGVTDWSRAPVIRQPGASGVFDTCELRAGEIQQRVVTYSAAYLADHWCSKGHVLYVLAGALVIEHEDGAAAHPLSTGMSWHVGDGEAPAHRVRSESGAVVFIVD